MAAGTLAPEPAGAKKWPGPQRPLVWGDSVQQSPKTGTVQGGFSASLRAQFRPLGSVSTTGHRHWLCSCSSDLYIGALTKHMTCLLKPFLLPPPAQQRTRSTSKPSRGPSSQRPQDQPTQTDEKRRSSGWMFFICGLEEGAKPGKSTIK